MKGTLLKDFGGRDRWLRCDANAFAVFGERLGVKVRLGHMQEDLFNTPVSLDALRVGIWACLLHEDPDLTVEEVGGWIDLGFEGNATEVATGFFEHFFGTSPEAEELAGRVLGDEPKVERTAEDEPMMPLTMEAGAVT